MKRSAGRLVALLTAFLLALGGVLVRLAVLQVSQADTLRELALEQRLRTVELAASRGRILDREGEELAVSLDASDVYADPRYVEEPADTARWLAEALEMKPREIREAIEDPRRSFAFVARQVDLRLARKVEQLALPGIGLLPVSKRYYPGGELAPQVIGFVGVDGVGLDGLEFQYQDTLAGTPGERTVEIDPEGRPILGGVNEERPPVPGSDIVTTIDRYLQHQAQDALARAVKANRAKGGTIVVLDPATGEVLAMASYPWFDPNSLDPDEADAWRNRAVTDMYEPGSVNKVITTSAVVEEAVLGLDEPLFVPDRITVANDVFHDAHPHPARRMTIADIISDSSNVGTIMLADRLGSGRLAEYLARYGFGQPTGIDFPAESHGDVPQLYDWWPTSMATIPIGQGIAVTPLQMAAVYATIANGGEWVQPRLVRGTVGPDRQFRPLPDAPSRRVVSRRTAKIVTRMLAYAVDDGTGVAAQIPGYQVAGKTGTARKPFEDKPGYAKRYIASFMGFLPASSPRVVIAAILDEPATVYGGIAAAPLFQEIARYAIMRMGIEPGRRVSLPPRAAELP